MTSPKDQHHCRIVAKPNNQPPRTSRSIETRAPASESQFARSVLIRRYSTWRRSNSVEKSSKRSVLFLAYILSATCFPAPFFSVAERARSAREGDGKQAARETDASTGVWRTSSQLSPGETSTRRESPIDRVHRNRAKEQSCARARTYAYRPIRRTKEARRYGCERPSHDRVARN